MTRNSLVLPADYAAWLVELKNRIAGARQRIALAANAEQIQFYHELGRDILDCQASQGWGAKVIDHLSADLRAAFPDMKGLSSSNLKYMRYFAQECPDRQFGQQSADQLPWFHTVTLLTQVRDTDERAWYARQAVAQAWSRGAHQFRTASPTPPGWADYADSQRPLPHKSEAFSPIELVALWHEPDAVCRRPASADFYGDGRTLRHAVAAAYRRGGDARCPRGRTAAITSTSTPLPRQAMSTPTAKCGTPTR